MVGRNRNRSRNRNSSTNKYLQNRKKVWTEGKYSGQRATILFIPDLSCCLDRTYIAQGVKLFEVHRVRLHTFSEAEIEVMENATNWRFPGHLLICAHYL